MMNYSTAGEKALDWNISIRYIQYLCRLGKVEGAVKRAGAWFIPDTAPVPAKNTKSNGHNFKYVGTKSRIFDGAIELFRERGYENVSFKDIAMRLGVRQSTIYNHFKTKNDILNAIYDYYCHYYINERLSLEEFDRIWEKGSASDVIEAIRYEFKEEYRQKMSDITIIIFQRIGIDQRAKEIANTLVVSDGIKYVENIFDSAVADGFLPCFDTHSMAVFLNIVRIFTLYYWISDTSDENRSKVLKDEQTLYHYAAQMLEDLRLQAEPIRA